jgi:hypothetical protein
MSAASRARVGRRRRLRKGLPHNLRGWAGDRPGGLSCTGRAQFCADNNGSPLSYPWNLFQAGAAGRLDVIDSEHAIAWRAANSIELSFC